MKKTLLFSIIEHVTILIITLHPLPKTIKTVCFKFLTGKKKRLFEILLILKSQINGEWKWVYSYTSLCVVYCSIFFFLV